MNKIKLTILFLIVISLLTGCAFLRNKYGNDILITKQYAFKDFSVIDVHDHFKVEVIQSDHYEIIVTADSNIMEYVEVEKKGDRLKVGLRKHYKGISDNLSVYIVLPHISEVELSGNSQGVLMAKDIQNDLSCELSGNSSLIIKAMISQDLHMELSGSSDISGILKVNNVYFEVSGSSKINLSGVCNDVIINSTGNSNLELKDLIINNAYVELSEASKGEIQIYGKLNCELSGASSLFYTGTPEILSVELTGSSMFSEM